MPNVTTARPTDRRIVLVLQGGGALGSYQAGVYEALEEHGYLPDWVNGISIGAINAAIIAGNPPGKRIDKLRAFWDEITQSNCYWANFDGFPPFEYLTGTMGAMGALVFGQSGFFTPRSPLSWLGPQPPASFYDTTQLKQTLERLVDFDRIAAGETRLTVGAVNVRTGRFRNFDNTDPKVRIQAEHVMASGALPPGFPAVEVEGEYYWDGGLISNTPLEYVLESYPREDSVIFQVDLFQSYGKPPHTLDEAMEREKDIRYASRTRTTLRYAEHDHNIRAHAHALWDKLPPMLREMPEAQFLDDLRCTTQMDIALLIYRPFEPQGSSKDFEFSHATMQARWDRGREDAKITLEASPWKQPFPVGRGTRITDVLHDRYIAELGADAAKPSPSRA
jgi:NTE family protein